MATIDAFVLNGVTTFPYVLCCHVCGIWHVALFAALVDASRLNGAFRCALGGGGLSNLRVGVPWNPPIGRCGSTEQPTSDALFLKDQEPVSGFVECQQCHAGP